MTEMETSETPAERRRRGPRFAQNFMSVLEISRDMVCLCVEGRIIDINSAGLALLGAQQARQVENLSFRKVMGGDYAAVIDELLHLKEIETSVFPAKLLRLDGHRSEVELQIHPARELGEAHAVVIARDISRQGHLARTARDSEARFRVLVEQSMHLIAQCHGGRIIYMNESGARMLGAEASLQGLPVAEIFHGEYREIFAEDLSVLLAEDSVMPVRLARRDGSVFDAQIRVSPLPSKGAVPEFMIEARDITAHHRAVAALRHMNETLEQQVVERTRELGEERSRAVAGRVFVENLLDAVPNPLWWKDVEGLYRGYNRAFRDMHGVDGKAWLGLSSAETLPSAFAAIAEKADHDAMGECGRVQFEARLDFADGQCHDVVVSKTAWSYQDNKPEGIIGVMLDITERKRMEAELRRYATTDALTGIFNRRHFMQTAATEIERSHRYKHSVSALMLDIDFFKRINDTFGHPVGDEAIKAMAAACRSAIRGEDILGRLGGEEFAIMLPETDLDAAMVAAERIRQAVSEISIPTPKGPVVFTASIGAAQLNETDSSVETLLSRADAALYEAKTGGRNRVVAG
ncbi:FOG: GGDEF domain [Candidatus Terasakiella magnetica]|nr:FOG: GGDEF domain [Candidatus Terasakiella magnetica]